MIENATGYVLRVRPLTDTSLIVHWLTKESGRLATVAKGARRPKSPFAGKIDLFHLADFSFQRSRRSELHLLREVSLKETHAALRQDLGALHQASYAAALIEQATELDAPIPEVFELMTGLLQRLRQTPPQPQTVFAFELKLLDVLGLRPDLDKDRLRPDLKQILKTLLAGDWTALPRLKLTAPQLTSLGHFLHGFILFHLGKVPTSRARAIA